MEAVHVLVRRDGVQYGVGIEVGGQRQLDEDTVYLRVGVERGDLGEQFRLGGVSRQAVFEAVKSRFFCLDAFVAYIDFACRIFADEDDGEAGRDAGFFAEGGGFLRDLGADGGGEGFAVDDCGAHFFLRLCFTGQRRWRRRFRAIRLYPPGFVRAHPMFCPPIPG